MKNRENYITSVLIMGQFVSCRAIIDWKGSPCYIFDKTISTENCQEKLDPSSRIKI